MSPRYDDYESRGVWRRGRGPSPLGWAAVWIAGVVATIAILLLVTGSDESEPAGSGGTDPNIVLVMTDDQTLAQLEVMERTQELIGDAGATFGQAVTNYPLCCPSRATLLTGQYAHNHGVLSNSGRDGGFSRFQELHGDDNLAYWLQDAGYKTAIVGKYLNLYRGDVIPGGWDSWQVSPFPTDQDVYDFEMFDPDGELVSYGASPEDFKQDVITTRSVEFIDDAAGDDEPYFLWVSYTAPHGVPAKDPLGDCQQAAQPAPRHTDQFSHQPLPPSESFNEADVSDKPAYVADAPPLTEAEQAKIEREYDCALASLQSVDEGVGEIVAALERSGELDNTYVIFTSDNGLTFGEHRLVSAKINPYEESIRVPLLVRGPEIEPGTSLDQVVSNADLPAMIEAVAKTAGVEPDGRSLLETIADPASGDNRAVLVEADKQSLGPQFGGTETLSYQAVRTGRYMYIEYESGERELYDLESDPAQLDNLAADPAQADVAGELADLLAELADCAGADCVVDAPPELG